MKKSASTFVLAILLVSSLSLVFRIEPEKATPVVADPNYTLQVFAIGLNGPFGMAFDSSGNLYVANEGAGGGGGTTVSKITPDGTVSTYATGFFGPAGLAFDNKGNLWVSDDTSHVWKITANGSIVLGSDFEFGNPNAIAFDKDWNLLVTSHIYGCIYKMDQNGLVSVFAGPFSGPQALAFDELGNVYTSDGTGTIFKIDPSGSVEVFSTGILQSTQGGLAFDQQGNLYASESCGPMNVYVFAPDGEGKPFVTGFEPTGFNFPRGLIFDNLGRLYITEYGTGIIWRVRVANKLWFEVSHGHWYHTVMDKIDNVPMLRDYHWLFQINNLKDETGQPMTNPSITVSSNRTFVDFWPWVSSISDGNYTWSFPIELPEDALLPTGAVEPNYLDYHSPGFSTERIVTPQVLVEPITIQNLSLTFTLEEPLPDDANSISISIGSPNFFFHEERLVNYTILSMNDVEGWELGGNSWHANPSNVLLDHTYRFEAVLEAVKSPSLEGTPTAKPAILISYAHVDDLGSIGIGSSATATHPEGPRMTVTAEGNYEWFAAVTYSRQDFWFHEVVSEVIENPDPPPPYAVRIPATIDIKPDSYNLGRRADCVTGYIELPEGYDVRDINVSTLLLDGIFPAHPKPTEVGDYDHDGIPDLMVKFDVSTLHSETNIAGLASERFMSVTVAVTGRLRDGTLFQGTDTIKIILPNPKAR